MTKWVAKSYATYCHIVCDGTLFNKSLISILPDILVLQPRRSLLNFSNKQLCNLSNRLGTKPVYMMVSQKEVFVTCSLS
jgi:hypothetical protein